jgi:hypothetical protein
MPYDLLAWTEEPSSLVKRLTGVELFVKTPTPIAKHMNQKRLVGTKIALRRHGVGVPSPP